MGPVSKAAMMCSSPNHSYQLRRLAIVLMIILCLGIQITLKTHAPNSTRLTHISTPPAKSLLTCVSLGDPHALSYALLLWLQQADKRGGISLAYHELNYSVLISWLEQIQALNPHTQYPSLLATRIWGRTRDHNKGKQMLDFVERNYIQYPNNWRWLAEATTVAKHRFHHLELALQYAQTLATYATPETPFWAKDMRLILLEELNELETAQLLIGAMLASGTIEDPYELNYLKNRLDTLQKRQNSAATLPSN